MLDWRSSYFDYYSRSSYAPYLRQHRLAGVACHMIEVAQPPGDFSDPPIDDLVIIRAVSDGMSQRSDLGGGRFEARSRPGDLFLVAPGTTTDILVHNDHVIRCFAFPAALLRPHLEEARPNGEPFDFGRLQAGPFRHPLVLSLLDRLWDQAEGDHRATRLFADGAVLTIAGALLDESTRRSGPEVGGLPRWQLKRVESYLAEHVADDLPLAELAATIGLSPFHFARAFKASTGHPPHRYQMMLRVERAKEMLAGTNQSVTEIAHACGFASSQHMATVFRRIVGATPSSYRQEALR